MTAVTQAKSYFKALSSYYDSMRSYYQNPTGSAPSFMEILPGLDFSDLLTESAKYARGNPSMISGAMIEATSSMSATMREAGIRAKVRGDFFAEAESSSSDDATFYTEQGQLLSSFMSGRNDAQT